MGSDNILCLGLSDVGNVREHNEDSFIVDDANQICIVADGVGGNLAGEVASKFVTDLLYKELKNSPDEITQEKLNFILKIINLKLLELAKSNHYYKGMSTTLVFMVKLPHKTFIGNIGDSRAYLLRNSILRQVTKDHSVVQKMVDLQSITPEEAFDHPLKHYLTMALGNETICPDIIELKLYKNDIILLCTDGLTDMVTDSEIKDILIQQKSLEDRIIALKNKALDYGGRDNVSIILARI